MDSLNLDKKVMLLVEFESLLKFNLKALDKISKFAEEEILVVTLLGRPQIDLNSFMNQLLGIDVEYYDNEKPGLWINADIYPHKFQHIKILFLSVPDISCEQFNEKIFGMIHAISSIVLLLTDNYSLDDLNLISKLPKTISGTNNQEEILLELSPKFVLVVKPTNIDTILNEEEVLENIIKNDDQRDIFTSIYKEKRAFVLGKSNSKFEEILQSIKTNSFCKSFRGKKNNGLTLRNMMIEFVNCINQKIGFNITKM